MNNQEKIREILKILDRPSIFDFRSGRSDSRVASINPLPSKTSFCIFNRRHNKTASDVIKILLATDDFDDYLDTIDDVRKLNNDGLFLYTLYSSVRHRDDCVGVVLPPIEERIPHLYFAAETIHDAIQRSINQPNAVHSVKTQKTPEDSDPESRLAYFREDIGLNRHHWSWHVVYPINWDEVSTGKIKDRKGEIFYYMHQQMIARYDCERLSNGLTRVVPLDDFQEKLTGFSPHMTTQTTGVHFGSRPEGLTMRDIPDVSLRDMEVWRLRIIDAIDQGYVRDFGGDRISLRNDKGIDILGGIVESSSFSVNPGFYGDLHNMGHNIISYAHDPDGKFREGPGVMAFAECAARDPIFYRWHKFVDDIFVRHKATLEPYTTEELSFEGIKIVSAEVKAKERNVIDTFMREAKSDLSRAHFLRTNGKILVEYEHLDHEPLEFIYKIENTTDKFKHATIRVFLGPKYNESGNLLDVNEQRRLMFELDKTQKLVVPGMNTVIRKDSESSVTTSREISSYGSLAAGNVESSVDFCSCGWPEYMLVPRGTPMGMEFNLFVMCTDYNEDRISSEVEHNAIACSSAVSYCGSRDQKYPDKKPMGFPFDRGIDARTMSDFLTSNMILTDVKIKFLNEVQPVTDWTILMYENV